MKAYATLVDSDPRGSLTRVSGTKPISSRNHLASGDPDRPNSAARFQEPRRPRDDRIPRERSFRRARADDPNGDDRVAGSGGLGGSLELRRALRDGRFAGLAMPT